jgi:AcrR family transcriptional regulator
MARRLSPERRREEILTAALAVMLEKGIGATTVRDVAERMGTSSGLVHHYFASMDDLLAAAFDLAASRDLEETRTAMAAAGDPVRHLRVFFATYTRSEQDWAFQLWLDAWAESARRPALRATSLRLNTAWQHLVAAAIETGVEEGSMRQADPEGSAWRILSLLDGLALQTVVHRVVLDPDQVVRWSSAFAETELGLPAGSLRS